MHSRFVLAALIFLLGGYQTRAQAAPNTLPEAQINEVAAKILKNADKAGCKPQKCKILVANFTLPSGLTSQFGIQLADALSKELASQQNGIQAIDRSFLQGYIEKERIPPDLLANDKAVRWLGKQLRSTAVLMGTTKTEGSLVRVQIKLLSCDKDKKGPTEVFTLPLPDSMSALSGIDPIAKLLSMDKSSSASTAYTAGVGRVTQPACIYCPNPDYTSEARAAEFQGGVLLKVVISPEGRIATANIVRGAPWGLNEKALEALRQWKFKPSTRDGKPVPVSTMIEIVFRLL